MGKLFVSFVAGLLFSGGLLVSGMINPAKVLSFLDITGAWDPTLAFVLGGALLVTAPAFHFVLRRRAPLLSERFFLPEKKRVDVKLASGAVIFGIGWGLAGLCPGPALTALGAGVPVTAWFVVAMVCGAWLQGLAMGSPRSGNSTERAS